MFYNKTSRPMRFRYAKEKKSNVVQKIKEKDFRHMLFGMFSGRFELWEKRKQTIVSRFCESTWSGVVHVTNDQWPMLYCCFISIFVIRRSAVRAWLTICRSGFSYHLLDIPIIYYLIWISFSQRKLPDPSIQSGAPVWGWSYFFE